MRHQLCTSCTRWISRKKYYRACKSAMTRYAMSQMNASTQWDHLIPRSAFSPLRSTMRESLLLVKVYRQIGSYGAAYLEKHGGERLYQSVSVRPQIFRSRRSASCPRFGGRILIGTQPTSGIQKLRVQSSSSAAVRRPVSGPFDRIMPLYDGCISSLHRPKWGSGGDVPRRTDVVCHLVITPVNAAWRTLLMPYHSSHTSPHIYLLYIQIQCPTPTTVCLLSPLCRFRLGANRLYGQAGFGEGRARFGNHVSIHLSNPALIISALSARLSAMALHLSCDLHSGLGQSLEALSPQSSYPAKHVSLLGPAPRLLVVIIFPPLHHLLSAAPD